MVDYTNPVKATFEFQRNSFEQGQQAVEQALDFQQQVGAAAVDNLDAQESVQRRTVELQQQFVHSVLDAVEANVPGAEQSVGEFRAMIDEQYETLLDTHADVFDTVSADLEEGIASVDDLSEDYVTMLDDQLAVLSETHEELEAQSVEVADELQEQVEEVSAQAKAMQDQLQEVSDQADDSIEA